MIQVAFPASVDLLVFRDHSAVPSPFPVSFKCVIFNGCLLAACVCLREIVHACVYFTTVKTPHEVSGSKQVMCNNRLNFFGYIVKNIFFICKHSFNLMTFSCIP